MSTLARAWLRRAERWLLAPEPHAAGRMGIFRILYGLFYLWHLSLFDLALVAGMPADYRAASILLVDALPFALGEAGLRALDGVLVASLALLVFGVRVRIATAVVLAAGVLREGLLAVVNVENSNVFLVFLIPLFMLVVGRWGETYSIDAQWTLRRTGRALDPDDDAGGHFLAARALLVLLAALFTSSPLFKTLAGGTWLSEPMLLTNLALQRSVEATALGLPANPLGPWLVDHASAGAMAQLGILAFEGLFFLSLLDRKLRSFFVASACVFHSINAFFLVVSFAPVLIVYALFVDWQRLIRFRRHASRPAPGDRLRIWTLAAVATAILLAATWRLGAFELFRLGGLVDWRTIWMPVFPLALAWAGLSALRLVRSARLLVYRSAIPARDDRSSPADLPNDDR